MPMRTFQVMAYAFSQALLRLLFEYWALGLAHFGAFGHLGNGHLPPAASIFGGAGRVVSMHDHL
jgi:hypothetical protein